MLLQHSLLAGEGIFFSSPPPHTVVQLTLGFLTLPCYFRVAGRHNLLITRKKAYTQTCAYDDIKASAAL